MYDSCVIRAYHQLCIFIAVYNKHVISHLPPQFAKIPYVFQNIVLLDFTHSDEKHSQSHITMLTNVLNNHQRSHGGSVFLKASEWKTVWVAGAITLNLKYVASTYSIS